MFVAAREKRTILSRGNSIPIISDTHQVHSTTMLLSALGSKILYCPALEKRCKFDLTWFRMVIL